MIKKRITRCLAFTVAAVTALVSMTTVVSAKASFPFSGGAQPNIVGGQKATQSWTVSLQSLSANGARHECGGTLIAPQWVMTAAHCAPYVTGQARIGSTNWKQGGEVVGISKVISNPAHDSSKNFGNDIALVKLSSASTKQPVPLGVYGGPGSQGIAQGWGITCDTDVNAPGCGDQTPDDLQQLAMRRAPGQTGSDSDHYCDLVNAAGVQLNDPNTMMCLVTADGSQAGICFGDSGSPFLQGFSNVKAVTGIIIALMNNTVATPHICSQTPTGGPNRDAATKVAAMLPWIIQTLVQNDASAAQYVQDHIVTL